MGSSPDQIAADEIRRLQERWPYIDIDRNTPENYDDWYQLISDVLEITSARHKNLLTSYETQRERATAEHERAEALERELRKFEPIGWALDDGQPLGPWATLLFVEPGTKDAREVYVRRRDEE